MTTLHQTLPETPIYASFTFWGLMMIGVGTAVGAFTVLDSPGLTHAINIGMVVVGSLIIIASSGNRPSSL